MKLLGMIGGMSWENTIEYYKGINTLVKKDKGEWSSAKILLYSVDFSEILPLQNENRWGELTAMMIRISKKLENAGCVAIFICSNTMHKIADEIEANISIPLIHVVDATAEAIKNKSLNIVGLLGTRFTMEGGFYVKRLTQKHGLQVILPKKEERDYIHHTIYKEFAQGTFLEETKEEYLAIIENLRESGAEGIILGCTEIPMLIKPKDVEIPLFDTLQIHLNAAVKFILSSE
ncbi:MAG: putative racemase YgeA [Promethearchaeota archaeon]|nr:MAG: putative racemase YgeA [Candidatus Lokiarchaeota archaeon]